MRDMAVPHVGRNRRHSVLVTRSRDRWVALAFVAPTVFVIATFVVWPFLTTVRSAFYDVDLLGRVGRYVGLRRFRAVFGSYDFRSSLLATFKFVALTMPAGLVVGLVLALLAYRPMRAITLFRVIFSSTIATSTALSSAMFVTLFAPSNGAVRYLFQSIGLLGADDRIDLLNDDRWAIVAVAVTSVWAGLGFGFILFSAALQSVPVHVYESAALDGAGSWATFRYITLPLIRPFIGVVAIVGTTTSVLSFGQIDFLTRGGPDNTTNVLAYSLYNRAFRDGDLSAAAVLAIALIVVALALGLAQTRFLRNRFEDAIV